MLYLPHQTQGDATKKKADATILERLPDIGLPDCEWRKTEDEWPEKNDEYLCIVKHESVRGPVCLVTSNSFDKRKGWITAGLVLYWRPFTEIEKMLIDLGKDSDED